MEGQEGIELRKNALKWKTIPKDAMLEQGSFDKNMEWFVNEIASIHKHYARKFSVASSNGVWSFIRS